MSMTPEVYGSSNLYGLDSVQFPYFNWTLVWKIGFGQLVLHHTFFLAFDIFDKLVSPRYEPCPCQDLGWNLASTTFGWSYQYLGLRPMIKQSVWTGVNLQKWPPNSLPHNVLMIALIAGRGPEDPTIAVVMKLTDCSSGLDSQFLFQGFPHLNKYKNTNTQLQKYKYTNTNTILVVMMLTNCPSGLDSQKRLSLWVEAGRACVHFTFGTKQGRGEEKARVKTGPKRWVGGQLTRKGEKGRKSHLQPCKEPSGGGQ